MAGRSKCALTSGSAQVGLQVLGSSSFEGRTPTRCTCSRIGVVNIEQERNRLLSIGVPVGEIVRVGPLQAPVSDRACRWSSGCSTRPIDLPDSR